MHAATVLRGCVPRLGMLYVVKSHRAAGRYLKAIWVWEDVDTYRE